MTWMNEQEIEDSYGRRPIVNLRYKVYLVVMVYYLKVLVTAGGCVSLPDKL